MPKRGSTCMKAAKTDVMSDQLHSGLYRRSSNTQIMCCHKHRQLERHCPAPWKMFSWQYLLALLCETCPSHTGCTAALRLWNKVWQLCKPSKVKVQRNSQLACCRKGYTGETGNRIAAKYLLTASDVITGCNTQVSVSPVDGAVISQGSAAVLRSYQHKPYWVSGACLYPESEFPLRPHPAEGDCTCQMGSYLSCLSAWGTKANSACAASVSPDQFFFVFSYLSPFRLMKPVCTTHNHSVTTYSDRQDT